MSVNSAIARAHQHVAGARRDGHLQKEPSSAPSTPAPCARTTSSGCCRATGARPLGDAIAHYGRISKTLHILRLADEPGYRRWIKVQANLQEGRHALARKIFHGKQGQLYHRYQDGMEDRLGALGLVLNALVLFNTRYMDAAVNQLRANGFNVRDEDVARLSPFVRHHINMLGRYSFQLPELPGGLRPLCDKDATDDE
ncbi:Tn3 family transposase [Nonomuraea sp. NEAU-A123]|nr:Tn3 family transposase [Nonomuraea sp. NEAU-A123]